MSKKEKEILIVDDDKFLREMYVTKFSSAGFKVSSAGSVDDAIDILAGGYDPDVLLFDIIMPNENGWDLIEQIKENEYIEKAKKIVLSNQGEERDLEAAKEHKVDGYIVKALNTPGEVVKKVQKISEK